MRWLALLPFLLACGAGSADDARFIRDFRERAQPLACTPAAVGDSLGTVAELSARAEGGLLAVFPDDRLVLALNDELVPQRTIVFDADGPRGVATPISAVVLNGILHVIDRQRPLIRRFRQDGTPLSAVELDFLPLHLASAGGRILITPAVVGRYPASLLFVLDRETAEPIDIPVRDFANVAVKMLGNMTATAALGDRLLVAHQFMTPRAYVWRYGSRPEQRPIPLPAELERSVGYVPPLPLDEAALEPVLTVALAASADPVARRFILLTRTGGKRNGHFEKALIRTDSALNFLDAFLLAQNAGHFAYLPRRRVGVLIDDEGRWFTCPLP
ncbi:MAG: hypothetical protein ACT443_06175 [Gemmatimonadota bacterium]